jgi:hypothetical protein
MSARSELSRAMRTRIGKATLGVIVVAALASAAYLRAMRGSDSPSPQLNNGWVTNCTGAAFGRFSQDGNSGPGPERPVFKISDELVLAVPKRNWPSAGKFDRVPSECRQISDLPLAPYLYFVISGNWSAGYKPEEVPIVGGNKQFQPDIITVRIQRAITNPLSVEDQNKAKEILREFHKKEGEGSREIGGLTCSVPKYAGSPPHCSGRRPNSELNLFFSSYSATPFVFVNADYPSSHYGKIQVYWQGWISDVSHSIDIDAAIWKSIEDWDLLNNSGAQADAARANR